MLNRILMIDDSDDIEYLVRNCAIPMSSDIILEMYDPRCGIPESSFNWSRYDLVLLDFDLGIPNQNGLDWLKQFKKNRKLPPVIMLTAYGTKKLESAALVIGAEGFMDKSKLTSQLFSDTVNTVFTKRRNRDPTQGLTPGDELTQALNADEVQQALNKAQSSKSSSTTGMAPDFEQTHAFSSDEIAAHTGSHRDQTSTDAAPVTSSAAVSRKPGPGGGHPPATETAGRVPFADATIIIPGYKILQKIGEGGMASIYLAELEEDKIKVVLKVLSMKSKMYDSSLLRRFMREYKLIAQIQHPNIIQIYERAFASSFAYIAMEYFSHGDLAERLKVGIDSKTAINFLHQITEGLRAAHAQGIVHRDMKPANILFRSPTNLAIADFGIAKDVESESMIKKQLTMEGDLMGTLYYLSPEQILGARADRRSDIYSLGVIMYKMLTGKHPYTGTSPAQVFEGHLKSPVPVLPSPFASLQPLLDGLLAKDPAERFQSTDDLLMGLNWQEWI